MVLLRKIREAVKGRFEQGKRCKRKWKGLIKKAGWTA
jgi:hypothetical protein